MENMDELSAGISRLLEDPEELERMKKMAESLFGGAEKKETPDLSAALGDLGDMGTIMQIGRMLSSDAQDDRTRLLMALKPHLSAKRQDRVDRAVKLLRIATLLPLISDKGLL